MAPDKLVFSVRSGEVVDAIETSADMMSIDLDPLKFLAITQGQAFDALIDELEYKLQEAWMEIVIEATNEYVLEQTEGVKA